MKMKNFKVFRSVNDANEDTVRCPLIANIPAFSDTERFTNFILRDEVENLQNLGFCNVSSHVAKGDDFSEGYVDGIVNGKRRTTFFLFEEVEDGNSPYVNYPSNREELFLGEEPFDICGIIGFTDDDYAAEKVLMHFLGITRNNAFQHYFRKKICKQFICLPIERKGQSKIARIARITKLDDVIVGFDIKGVYTFTDRYVDFEIL